MWIYHLPRFYTLPGHYSISTKLKTRLHNKKYYYYIRYLRKTTSNLKIIFVSPETVCRHGVSCFMSGSWNMLIKIQPDATVCRYLFTEKTLYMFRVSQHPSSGVLKTITATSGTGYNTGTWVWSITVYHEVHKIMSRCRAHELLRKFVLSVIWTSRIIDQ